MPLRDWIDVIESWMWEHFSTEEQVEEWLVRIERPHHALRPCDILGIVRRAAVATGRELLARAEVPDLRIEAVPDGWDDESLLAESLAAAAGG